MNTIRHLQSTVGEVNRANGWHEGTVTPVERLARGWTVCAQCHRADGTHKLDCTARGGEQND